MCQKFQVTFSSHPKQFATLMGTVEVRGHGVAELCKKIIVDVFLIKEKSFYNLRSNDELILAPPTFKSKKTLGDRAFQVPAPTLWNKHPKCIKDGNKLEAF